MRKMDFIRVNKKMWTRMREETEWDQGRMLRWFAGWIFTIVLWMAWMQGPRDYLLEVLGIKEE